MPAEPIPHMTLWMAWIVAVLPLISFVAIMIFLRHRPKTSAAVSISAVTVSFIGSLVMLIRHWHMTVPMSFSVRWMISGHLSVPLGILIDPLRLLMLVIVSLISLLVQLYSIGYMEEDPGYARYFAFMSLFAWSMLAMVLSSTVLVLYIFWELVGLASYLLIGFWYEKFSATEAGKKAFMMTRIGDVAFFLGLLILLIFGGSSRILDLNAAHLPHPLSPELITVVGLLIIGGIVGKSAQFPLLTWLPDAMEGPTPVSALLHSATMVAAGVYLFGRLFPFFSQSPTAMTVMLAIATLSMLMSGTMAIVSRDIKKVWAFSTISQLGFMLMALGAGGYFAGIFHLTTHAGFKALLFLCAGVLIHLFETNDIFDLANMGVRRLKIPMICMTIGGAALSGIWPFSGFFSKEAIMLQLSQLHDPIWLVAGLAGVFLTAYYTFRLLFIVWFPRAGESKPADAHAHGSRMAYWVMAGPLVILATVTVFLGFAGSRIDAFLLPGAMKAEAPHWLTFASLGLALSAVCVAWFEFGRAGASQVGFVEKMAPVREFFAQRWYLDRIYNWCVEHFVDKGISRLCKESDDRVVDGILHAIAGAMVKSGGILSNRHRAMIQSKLVVLFVVIFGLTLLMLL